jgi:arylsulfatase
MYVTRLLTFTAITAMALTLPAHSADKLDRTILPIQEPKRPAIITFDARKATAPPRFEVKAPNVLIVLIDDMGFGMSSSFGGPIQMPTVERLADNGLRYNHFHTTALCSPTRSALSLFAGEGCGVSQKAGVSGEVMFNEKVLPKEVEVNDVLDISVVTEAFRTSQRDQ